MPRTPSGPISSNIRKRNKKLSLASGGKIFGRALAGQSVAQIVEAERLPRTTSYDTINKALYRPHQHSLPRPGRPKALTERDERQTVHTIKPNPSITYKRLLKDLQLSCSIDNLQRVLTEHHIKRWRLEKPPELSREHAAARYQWAKAHKNWMVDQ